MTSRTIDQRILPKATADLRGQTILDLVSNISASFDWQRDLALRVSDIPAAALPHAIRSWAVQNYCDPAMSETHLRNIMDNALTIKLAEGTIKGVKFALGLLGMQVDWVQWHQMTPMGAPGTHMATIYLTERLFNGEPLLSERTQRHVTQMINTVKRHSQDVAFEIGAAAKSAVGAAAFAAINTPVLRLSGSIDALSSVPDALAGLAALARPVQVAKFNGRIQ